MKYNFKNELEFATLEIYDEIDSCWGISANDITEQLSQANNKPLNIYINSGGGEVFEGFAIYNSIKRYTGHKTVYIDGIAASIASVIAMAGDEVVMNRASTMMIHNASGGCYGNAEEMKQVVQALETINAVIKDVYKNKTGLDEETLTNLMDNETFMTPQECLEKGFCNRIYESTPNQEVTNKSMENFINDYDKKLKQFKDLKQALDEIGGNKDIVIESKEDAFLNNKKSHWDWLKKGIN